VTGFPDAEVRQPLAAVQVAVPQEAEAARNCIWAAETTDYRVELFVSPMCLPFGEGAQLLGAKSVSTAGAGGWSLLVAALASERGATATATRLVSNDTSQFSSCAATR